MKAEHKEWLGIAPADWPVYIAATLLFVMYKVDNFLIDILLASISLGLAIWACFIGMKHDPNVSRLTNFLKKITYPVFLAAAIIVIYLNFARWS